MKRLSKFVLLFLISCSGLLLGQNAPAKKQQKKVPIKIIHADKIEKGDSLSGGTVLTGSVRLQHKDTKISSDTLYYDAKSGFVRYPSGAVIVSPESTISSKKGEFNLESKVSSFEGNVRVKNPDATITSDRMTSAEGNASSVFEGNVRVVGKEYTVVSDKAVSKDNNKVITFTGKNVRIRGKDGQDIHTEYAVFFPKQNVMKLNTRSTIYDDGQTLTGDKIYFNKKTGYGKAQGNVVLEDLVERRVVKGNYAEVYKGKDSAFVTGNALAINYFEGDPIYIHSDTLYVVRNKLKQRLLKAFRGAKMYKKDLQGKARSIIYNETTGKLSWYGKPVLWSGYNQITGNVVHAYYNTYSKKMDSLRIPKQPFIANKVDSLDRNSNEFNQVKGNTLLGLFDNSNNLREVFVEGNARSLIYMDQDKKNTRTKERLGVNVSTCGVIVATFDVGSSVRTFSCEIEADSKLVPTEQFLDNQKVMDGFSWQIDQRPNSWQELLR